MAVPHLVAHRGCMAFYPENTLVSLEAAMQGGAQYVEFDLQCSADGELVLMHDTTLLRTCGVQGNVFEMTYEELKNIRAHEPERFSLAFFKQRIPHLYDVIKLLKKYPHVTAFVEIKKESLEYFGIENIMPRLMQDLEPIFEQCVIISYDYDALHYVQQYSHYKIGWVLKKYDMASYQKARELKPDFLIVNHNKLPANKECWQGEWQWMIYDINDPYEALEYESYGVEYVETRDICNMLQHPLFAILNEQGI